MNVVKIIEKYLKENGFDGLYQDDCGCFLDDLMPCGSWCTKCKPGYIGKDAEGDKGIFSKRGVKC